MQLRDRQPPGAQVQAEAFSALRDAPQGNELQLLSKLHKACRTGSCLACHAALPTPRKLLHVVVAAPACALSWMLGTGAWQPC